MAELNQYDGLDKQNNNKILCVIPSHFDHS